METIADGKVIIEIDAESKGFETGLDSVRQSAAQLADKELKAVETAASGVSDALQDTASAASEAGRIYESAFSGSEAVLKDNATAASAVADAVQEISDAANRSGSALSESMEESASSANAAADATEDAAEAIDEHTESTEENTDSTEDNTKSREENRDSTEEDSDSTEKNTKSTEANTKAKELASKAIKAVAAAAAALGTAMAAGAAAAVAAGSAYETAFAKTATIMDTNVVSAEAMSAAIIDLSNETGAAAKELSESVYDAISATGDTANAVSLVADASKLATAGFAEQGDALGVLTTIMNSYGMEASQAKSISDSLIQTQNLGVTTVGQLSKSMGKAIATASAYSIDLYNLESAYVSLTKAGISTEESTTYLASMFNELGDSGSTVAKIIRDETGMSFGQLMQSGASLADVLDILLVSVNGDKEALANLWGSAEAGKASMAIAGQGVETFNSNLENLRNSAGTTEKAYETMTQTLGYQTDLLKTRITNLGTTIYSYFDDSLTAGVSSLSDAFLALTESVTDGELSDEMEQIGAGFADLIESGAKLAADVLPAVVDGLAFLVEHGDALISMLGGAVAGFAAYKVATVASTIATVAATVAAEGFTAALAVNPIALAAAACIGLATALGVFVSTAEETLSPAEELRASIEDNKEEAEDLSDAISDATAKYRELKSEVASNTKNNAELISSLAELVDGYDGSATSASEIHGIIEQLNEAIPDLNLEFDEQAGLLNKTADELDALNKKYAAQSKYDAAVERRTQALADQETAMAALTAAKEDQAKAQQALNEFEEEHTHIVNGVQLANSGYELSWKNMKDAVDDASDAVDQASTNVEKAGGAVRLAQHDVERYGAELNEAADAASQFSTETEESATVLSEEAQAASEATSAIWSIASAAVDARVSGGDLRAEYEELSAQLEMLRADGDETAIMWAEQKLKMLEIAATNQELSESYSYLAEMTGYSLSSMSAWLIDSGFTADEWASQVNSAKDSVINGFQELDTSLDMSLQDMAAGLQSNIEAYTNWNSNIQSLMAAAVASGSQAAIDMVMYMQEMGIGAADQVQMMVDNIDYTMDTFPPLFADATAAGMTEVYNGIEGGKAQAATAASGLMDSVIAEVEGADTESAGADAGSGIDSGLESQHGNVQSTAQDLADAVTSTWESANGDFENSGTEAGTQIKIGLLNQRDSVSAAAQSLADGVNTAWTNTASDFKKSGATASSMISDGILSGDDEVAGAAGSVAQGAYSAFMDVDWYSLGYNISAGVADGVGGGSFLITSAAKSAAQTALSAAKSALGVASPSRVFRDEVGKMIPAGIAVGIKAETPAVTQSMQDTTDALLAKARAAVIPIADVGAVQQHITNITNYDRIVSTGQENTSEQLSLLRRIAEGVNSEGTVVNLTFPDGTKLASYLFQPLAKYAKANGTPIINPS